METDYLPADDPELPEDQAVLQFWVKTRDGARLWGMTIAIGPFDDVDSIAAQVTSSFPFSIVEARRVLQTQVVQRTLF